MCDLCGEDKAKGFNRLERIDDYCRDLMRKNKLIRHRGMEVKFNYILIVICLLMTGCASKQIVHKPLTGHDACVAELKPYGTEADCDIPVSELFKILSNL